MPFPKQERFTPESLAKYWSRTVNEIDELIRTVQFTHIIVEGEVIDRVSPSRLIYFDLDAWFKLGGEDLARACKTYREELEESITGDKIGKRKGYEMEWKENELEFDSAHLRKQYERYCGPMHLEIGPTKIAELKLFPSQEKEWVRPNAGVRVYIPRPAVEAFEKRHGIQKKVAPEETREQQDLSKIELERPYMVTRAAWWMGMNPDYLRNDLIPSGKLRAEKRGSRNVVLGREIVRYLKERSIG